MFRPLPDAEKVDDERVRNVGGADSRFSDAGVEPFLTLGEESNMGEEDEDRGKCCCCC